MVLNSRERNQTFYRFLFFFIVTVVLITGAVYFDMRIPSKENEVLRGEISRYQTQHIAQEKFINNMDDAKELIDSLQQPGVNAAYLNQQIAAKLRQLADLQYEDSSVYSRLNKDVIDLYLRYQEASNKVASMHDLPQQLQDYKSKYEQSERDLDQANRDLDLLRRSNAAGSY